MIRIEKIFENFFDDIKITDPRLQAFSEDHINKLEAWLTVHADADVSALLADLETKHNAYFGSITDEDTKLSIQQSRTIAADNAWTAALAFISKGEGAVKFKWGTGGAEYQEFYPQGVTEYHQATKLNKATLLTRYLNAATVHTADLPAGFAADFTALKNDWNTKFTAQQNQIGLVKDADSQTAINRDPVELQLSKNILILASKNIGHPEMVNDFFNQTLLQPSKAGTPATSLIVKGKVTHAVTGVPLANVPVSLTEPNKPGLTVTTDSNGNYEFNIPNLPAGDAGTVTIIITNAPGFQTFGQPLQVEVGNSYTLNIALQPV